MKNQETPHEPGGLEPARESPKEQGTGKEPSPSQGAKEGGGTEAAEPEGFRFYHMDLYEPRERLGIFADKQSTSKVAGLQDASQGVLHIEEQLVAEGFPVDLLSHDNYREDPACLSFPEAESGTCRNLMEFANILPLQKQFDPFEQIVDYSESASQCSEGLFSPISERSVFEESETEGTTTKFGDDVEESVRDLRSLRNNTSKETELEPDDQETAEDTTPDVYCQSCDIPIPAFEKLFGFHKHHSVIPLAEAAVVAKLECQNNLKKLEQQLIQMETFSNHLQEIFVTVEENIGKQEHYLELQYDDLMQFLVQRFEDRSQGLEEEKKLKLEKLYNMLVSCGHSMDGYKELMEATDMLFRTEDKQAFLKNGETILSRLEEFLQVDLNPELPTPQEFENFPTDMAEVQRLIDSICSIPVPSAPSMCPQSPDTATSTSVKVRWSLSADDTVEHYQLYYRKLGDNTQDEGAADASLRVKEMFCTVRNLQTGSMYVFWVTATNSAGTSDVSDRAVFTTVPAAPRISSRAVAVCQSAVFMEWEAGSSRPPQSYALDFCQVCCGCDWTESLTEATSLLDDDFGLNSVTLQPGTGRILKSLSPSLSGRYSGLDLSVTGITSCKALIELEPSENYIFYLRAVNEGGSSERSAAIAVRTTGTQLYLMEQTAHLSLSILQDGLTIVYNEESQLTDPPTIHDRFTSSATVMAQLVPVRGRHYWEVEVAEDMEYRIGIAYTDTPRDAHFGSNITSWCMRRILTSSRSKFEFLHKGLTPDLRITITPTRIGILLDYDTGKLSFFNVDICQLLFTFSHQFQNLVNPCFALESYGILKVSHNIPFPEFTKLL